MDAPTTVEETLSQSKMKHNEWACKLVEESVMRKRTN
jgi:hypothetical protein